MGFLRSLLDQFHEELERNHNRPFLRATMAACALAASADGKITFGERVRVDQILETLDNLKIFDPHEGVDLFNGFADAILETPETGRKQAFDVLKDVAKDDETKALILRICCAVSEVNAEDGEKNLVDQIEIVSLCSRLGIKPESCGLYTDLDPQDVLGEKS